MTDIDESMCKSIHGGEKLIDNICATIVISDITASALVKYFGARLIPGAGYFLAAATVGCLVYEYSTWK
jgi:hypothetical protein